MIKYKLMMHFLGSPEIDITKSEYEQIKKAQRNLMSCLWIEESFDILIDNYIELETTLLRSSFSSSIRTNFSYQEAQTERRMYNRRIMNYFTTTQSYIDQTNKNISNIFGHKSEEYKNLININRQIIQEDSLSCFMDELRNHVQHRGFPIQSISFSSRWDEKRSKLYFDNIPYLSIELVSQATRFQSIISSELKKIKYIDIRPLIIHYMEALGKIHNKIRGMIEQHVNEWETLTYSTMDGYHDKFSIKTDSGLKAITENNGSVMDSVPVNKATIETRKFLEDKNSTLVNLSKYFVSNEIKPNQK